MGKIERGTKGRKWIKPDKDDWDVGVAFTVVGVWLNRSIGIGVYLHRIALDRTLEQMRKMGWEDKIQGERLMEEVKGLVGKRGGKG